MQYRSLGPSAPDVAIVGYGGMHISIADRPDESVSVRVIHAALDAGVTLIDTADAYHLHADEVGHNEELIARALRSSGGDTADVLVATKGGHLRPGDGTWTRNGDPTYLKQAAKESARRLGVDAIGLYQFHRPDPATPWEESMAGLRHLYDAGLVRMLGISNADVAQIDVARSVIGPALVSVQNQFSPGWRFSADEVAHCAAHGLAFLPWSPFGGVSAAGSLDATAPAFAEVAGELGVSVYRVTLAWHLAQADVVVPIPGASRAASITDSAAAADLVLTPEQLARLDG